MSVDIEEGDIHRLDLQDRPVHRVGDGVHQVAAVHGGDGNYCVLREGALGGFDRDLDSAGGSLPALGGHGDGRSGCGFRSRGFFRLFFLVRGHEDGRGGNVVRVLRQDAVADDLFIVQVVAEGRDGIRAVALDGVDGSVLRVHMIDDAHVVDVRDLVVNGIEEDQVADGGDIVPSGEELTLLEALGHEGGRRVVRDVLGRDAGIAQAEGDEHRAPLYRVRNTVPGAVTGIAIPAPGVACLVQKSFKVIRTLASALLGGGDKDEVSGPVSAELQVLELTVPVITGLEVRVRIAHRHLGNRAHGLLGFDCFFGLIDGNLFGAEALGPMDMDV